MEHLLWACQGKIEKGPQRGFLPKKIAKLWGKLNIFMQFSKKFPDRMRLNVEYNFWILKKIYLVLTKSTEKQILLEELKFYWNRLTDSLFFDLLTTFKRILREKNAKKTIRIQPFGTTLFPSTHNSLLWPFLYYHFSTLKRQYWWNNELLSKFERKKKLWINVERKKNKFMQTFLDIWKILIYFIGDYSTNSLNNALKFPPCFFFRNHSMYLSRNSSCIFFFKKIHRLL